MWTISDFPGYAMLSGWPTRGANACPNCGMRTHSAYLKNGHKFCYCGHRRYLPDGHRMRLDRQSFDGTMDFAAPTTPITCTELEEQIRDVPTTYVKDDLITQHLAHRSRKRRLYEHEEVLGWKKKSIFFELPYWAENDIRHNLDVMHIEKNVCENVLHTLLGTKGKTKDNLNTRKDLQLLNIRTSLHPIPRPNGGFYLPAAAYTISSSEKKIFLSVLKNLRPPDGFSSNLSRRVRVEQLSIWGLKSHDCHVLMQKILAISLRRALPREVVLVLIELCGFFHSMCLHNNSVRQLEKLQERIALTLCHLEKLFPPSFFDVMEHLPIHLVEKAMIAGPVHYRWIYPIERYLGTLKRYVRNRAQPEGSIVCGYLSEECMSFCLRYLGGVKTKENRGPRHDDQGCTTGCGIGGVEEPTHIVEGTVTDYMKTLARGPNRHAIRYTSCIVGGLRFRVKSIDDGKKTRCAGVMLNANTMSFASARDINPCSGTVAYYGMVTDIIEVQYNNENKHLLFKCDWVDPERGMKEDEFRYKLVNFSHLMYSKNLPTDEPFCLATQARQIWYIDDPIDGAWSVVVPMVKRDNYDVYTMIDDRFNNRFSLDYGYCSRESRDYWVRKGVEGTIVEGEQLGNVSVGIQSHLGESSDEETDGAPM
ncbi:uncharacterized protein LOC127266277 [Andrographis paniculata]|uniref:uncharacterized protein LOC127266277 n=1 Tax=Andrographis paniculata TaxID=175694 RepID=UPI0021E99C7D|nr:uncharacterized protein LOC127266277 [Andrographis paniculata]